MSREAQIEDANRSFQAVPSLEHAMSTVQAVLSLKKESDRARGTALRLLALRPRTVLEIREQLGRRFGKDAVEETVGRLLSEGLLDDADYANQWRQSRERHKPRSRGMIARELKTRGVADDLIEDALEGYDSSDAARRAAQRYASRQSGAGRTAFDRRVGAFLARRGFEPSVIRQVLQELREELEVDNPSDDSV